MKHLYVTSAACKLKAEKRIIFSFQGKKIVIFYALTFFSMFLAQAMDDEQPGGRLKEQNSISATSATGSVQEVSEFINLLNSGLTPEQETKQAAQFDAFLRTLPTSKKEDDLQPGAPIQNQQALAQQQAPDEGKCCAIL